MGRHSAPDDYDDDAPVVLSGPPAATGRPRPGRHSGDGPEPAGRATPAAPDVGAEGLDIIETVMADDHDDADDADDRQVLSPGGPDREEHTEQIEPIVDPVLDEPLPVAVTSLISVVVDGETSPPRPSPQLTPHPQPRPAPAEALADSPPAAETVETGEKTDGADKAAAKAEAKAAKAAAKADAKAAKADAKTAKADAKAAKAEAKAAAGSADGAPAAPGRPDARVSDLALLRADSAARARVVAAIVVPFVLYVVVLLVLDALDLRTTLIWIWLPLITAGVVAGLLLDLAHRAAAARAIAALEAPAEPATTGPVDPA